MSDDISVLMTRSEFASDIIRIGDTYDDGGTIPHCILMNEDHKTLVLPFPKSINSTISPRWDIGQMGVGGAAVKSISEGSASDGIKFMGEGGLDLVKSKGAEFLGSAIGAQDASRTRDYLRKKILNPHKAMMFNGIDFRQIQLDFEIIPKSEDESDNLVTIIKTLQESSLPSTSGIGGGVTFFNYPGKWTIKFEPSEEYLPSFGESVLINMSVDYGGGQMSFHQTGGGIAPVVVNISLSLSEVEIMTKEVLSANHQWG